jgi:hypothetical protein
VTIDDTPQTVSATAGSYFTINHEWSGNNIVTIVMPQTLWFEKTPDDEKIGGVMYGAQVLAGCYGTNNLSSTPSLNASTVQKTSQSNLKFSGTASTGTVTLVPFYQMHNQRYSVYWNLTNIPTNVTLPDIKSIDQKLQISEIYKTSTHLIIDFSKNTLQNTPLNIELYTLDGAMVWNLTGVLAIGQRQIKVNLPGNKISSNILVCTIRAGNQSVKRLINYENR